VITLYSEVKERRWGGGCTSRKVGWGCAAQFLKPLPYLWPKSAFFATLFMTWPKIWYPIYDRCEWHSCSLHKLWRALVDGLVDKDVKVASSKKHTQFKTRALKPYPIYKQNGQNRYPFHDQNGWKTLPFGAAHTHVARIREYRPWDLESVIFALMISFCIYCLVHTMSDKFEKEFFTLKIKCIECFLSTLRQWNLKTQQSPVILDWCFPRSPDVLTVEPGAPSFHCLEPWSLLDAECGALKVLLWSPEPKVNNSVTFSTQKIMESS